jgi:hypothetical protein
MIDNVVRELAEHFLPLPVTKFFAPQRAAPNPETGDGGKWFGDELPPTMQDYLNSPEVRRAQLLLTLQWLQKLQASARRTPLR